MELVIANESAGVTVADALFGCEFKPALVHQVVTAYLAGGRAGTKAQKSRADVRGGGKKPWRQKGTGRARAGTIRSPLWAGGGATFAARPRNFAQKVNRKMYRGALRSIFSELVRQERLAVVRSLDVAEPKTRLLVAALDQAGVDQGRVLVILPEPDQNIALAGRNVPGLAVTDVHGVDPASLVGAEKVVITVDALNRIEEWLS